MSRNEPTRGPLTPVVFHVLVALADGPLHGYGIMKRVEDDSGQTAGPGTIYGSLQRLEEAGWVAEVDVGDNDPRRGKSFELTVSGRTVIAGELDRFRRLARLAAKRGLAADPAGAS